MNPLDTPTIQIPSFLVNGKAEALGISALDRGLAYGDGVFRTFPVRHAQPVNWDLHYARLAADSAVLGIACPPAAQLLGDIQQLFDNVAYAVCKVILTRGVGLRGYRPPDDVLVTRIVIRSAMPDYPAENLQHGVRLHLCQLRLSEQPALAGIKHLNRLENVLARMEWQDAALSEGLLLDAHDCAIECTSSNLFARFGDVVCTPDLSRCGVAGVTRSRILSCLPELGYQTEVAPLPLQRLLQADEVIICNSLYLAWQVIALAGTHWQAQPLAAQLRLSLQE